MKVIQLSETAIVVLYKQAISPENFSTVKSSFDQIQNKLNDYIVDIIISYASIHINFNLLKISGDELCSKIKQILSSSETSESQKKDVVIQEIPVYYGSEVALDLEFIAKRSGISTQEVIDIHSSHIYDVYAIGFAPGFAYLGNVNEKIACPRKETPRKRIAKGSLGIADQQTAIYPSDSPGGWQIVGRTPVSLVDFNSENLTPVSPGDKVKFVPVTKEQYLEAGGELECH
ncbi:MAG: 5-oxoprolinase subunit PxpB [Cellvibrionaceae bacterium]